ncbi:M10 family metallopeptidase C-terminal domain-containing protein, partial [Azospirillum sp. TSO22-1]|uniref:M10 family metallopeptidase C-terminal domain-containing protein n=1 Tax=Azospirillum sp. TSO22-1 TaxID=716789 RepID=UPI000D622DCE
DGLTGGTGNDVYLVDTTGVTVVESAGGGMDEVRTSLASYTLAAEVEYLTYTGSGNFTGNGNTLANLIQGGAGNDTLTGGGGSDTLTGAAGADWFKFGTADVVTGANADRITDFVAGTDMIDVSGVDANSAVSGDQLYSFIGTSAFSGTAGQLRYAVLGDGTTHLYGDHNGDRNADFELVLTGSLSLTAANFKL